MRTSTLVNGNTRMPVCPEKSVLAAVQGARPPEPIPSRHHRVHVHCGPVTRSPPPRWLVGGFSRCVTDPPSVWVGAPADQGARGPGLAKWFVTPGRREGFRSEPCGERQPSSSSSSMSHLKDALTARPATARWYGFEVCNIEQTARVPRTMVGPAGQLSVRSWGSTMEIPVNRHHGKGRLSEKISSLEKRKTPERTAGSAARS
jgi:hypothetical protein